MLTDNFHIRVETPERVVIESRAPAEFIRANFELATLKEEAKKLSGKLCDYGCEVYDKGLVYENEGKMSFPVFTTDFVISPLKKGAQLLTEIIEKWESMAACPVLRC